MSIKADGNGWGEGWGACGSWWWSHCENGGAAKWKLKSPFSVVISHMVKDMRTLHHSTSLSLFYRLFLSLTPAVSLLNVCVCEYAYSYIFHVCTYRFSHCTFSLCWGVCAYVFFHSFPFISRSSHVDVIKARGQSMTLAKPVYFGPVHVVILSCIFPQPEWRRIILHICFVSSGYLISGVEADAAL